MQCFHAFASMWMVNANYKNNFFPKQLFKEYAKHSKVFPKSFKVFWKGFKASQKGFLKGFKAFPQGLKSDSKGFQTLRNSVLSIRFLSRCPYWKSRLEPTFRVPKAWGWGVCGHFPPENFEILMLGDAILNVFNLKDDFQSILHPVESLFLFCFKYM